MQSVLKKTKLQRTMRDFKKNSWLLSMTLPGVLLLFGFAYMPMFGIVIAFKDYKFDKGIFGSAWVGFKNFDYLFSTADAWRITYNTLYMNFLFIIFGTLFSIGLALFMNEVKNRWMNRFLQSAFFLPYILSWVVVGIIVFALLKTENGLVNSLLIRFGMEPVEWYTKAAYWPAILVMVAVWKGAGYGSIIYLAGMMGINNEYYEAAKIDGARKLQQIWYVTLPLMVPLITILTLISIGRIFYADFGLFFNVTGDQGLLYKTTDVIDTYVFRTLRILGDPGMASAAGFYQSVVGFTLVILSNYVVRKIDDDKALF